MEFLDFNNKAAVREYETFLVDRRAHFLQSTMWVGVKNRWKHQVIISRDENGKIRASALVLVKRFPPPFKPFLYCPRGPVCDVTDHESLKEILQGLEELAHRYHAYTCKMDPPIEETDSRSVYALRAAGLGFTPWQSDDLTIQCRNNYVLDIGGRSEEELLASFKSKCRYNIRLAKRKGVTCRVYGKERLEDFQRLLEETKTRDGFEVRNQAYFARMLDSLGEHCRLYLCEYQGQALSGAICVQYGGRTTYVYGASASTHREVMPNYLMQWEMIRWAVEGGCHTYDFGGVPHWYDPNHPNNGVYRFKTGFNGRLEVYAGEFTKVYARHYKKAMDMALEWAGYWKLI